jgi:hypothetical protein
VSLVIEMPPRSLPSVKSQPNCRVHFIDGEDDVVVSNCMRRHLRKIDNSKKSTRGRTTMAGTPKKSLGFYFFFKSGCRGWREADELCAPVFLLTAVVIHQKTKKPPPSPEYVFPSTSALLALPASLTPPTGNVLDISADSEIPVRSNENTSTAQLANLSMNFEESASLDPDVCLTDARERRSILDSCCQNKKCESEALYNN